MLTSRPPGARRLITKNNAAPLAAMLRNAKVAPPRPGGLSFRFFQVLEPNRYPQPSIVVYLAAVFFGGVRNLTKPDIFSPSGGRSIPLIVRFNYPNKTRTARAEPRVTSWMVGDLMDGNPMQPKRPHASPATPRSRGDPMSCGRPHERAVYSAARKTDRKETA